MQVVVFGLGDVGFGCGGNGIETDHGGIGGCVTVIDIGRL